MKRNSRNYIRLALWLMCSLFFIANCAYAQEARKSDPSYLFYKGNTLYEEGRYDEAIKVYEKLLHQGMESGNLYYNLGNSYVKKGLMGKAVLNYERAKRLLPRDGDLKSNYKYARSKIKAAVSNAQNPFFKRVLGELDNFTIDETSIFISCIYTLIVILLIAGLFTPQFKKYFYPAVIVALTVVVLASYSLYSKITLLEKEAVIITDSVEAKFEPLDSATTHFTIYEGMKISIIQSKKDWLKIKRSDGKIGWIRMENSEII